MKGMAATRWPDITAQLAATIEKLFVRISAELKTLVGTANAAVDVCIYPLRLLAMHLVTCHQDH